MPPELESLFDSMELKASSLVNNIHSAYNHAATAIPTGLLTGVSGLMPAQTPGSDAVFDGAMSHKASYFSLIYGLAVVVVVCCALG